MEPNSKDGKNGDKGKQKKNGDNGKPKKNGDNGKYGKNGKFGGATGKMQKNGTKKINAIPGRLQSYCSLPITNFFFVKIKDLCTFTFFNCIFL